MVMKTEATRQTLAAPPRPCCATAWDMNGTVALAVPPINAGLRPSRAVIGAVMMDVTSPSTGGRPIMPAMARPYGSAIKAAMKPPCKSPASTRQLYFHFKICKLNPCDKLVSHGQNRRGFGRWNGAVKNHPSPYAL